MAKRKRKSGSAVKEMAAFESAVARANKEASRKRIRTYEDVADSDDEFQMNQDKILLDEEPDVKRRRRQEEQEEFLEQSDEELLGNNTSDEQSINNDEDLAADLDEEEDDDEGEGEDGWGTANMYGADAIETEEQALEEEAEARRLQKKQLQSMSNADYGFDEDDWKGDEVKDIKSTTVTEILPEEVSQDLAPAERLKMLRSRYPEFEPLRKELLAMQDTCRSFDATRLQGPNAVAKQRAAAAYLGSLAMYFALLTSNTVNGSTKTPLPAAKLRDHAIMTSLVDCRTTWQAAQALPADRLHKAEVVTEVVTEPVIADVEKTKPIKTRKERHAEAQETAKAARIAERLKQTEASFGDLDALLAPVTKTQTRKTLAKTDDSDLGEIPLTAAQAAEKAKMKKSLRFYTSQIAQKANKRGTAGRNAGGDDDVPHRERLRDRQARLNAEAEKRGKTRGVAGDDLGGASDDEDVQQAREIRDDGDDYYDMIAARTAKKKSDKVALKEAQREAEAHGGRVVQEESVGADGKRKVTYAIEKNKGLTPSRHNNIRNPRVKKRKKYEQKTKKLASMKPVYKGGEGRGGYGGELTGIKANLVKSTKL